MLDASNRKSITFTAWRGGFASFPHLRIFRHESCNLSLVRILGRMPTLNFSSSESLSCSLHGLCNMLSPGRSRHILLNIIPTCVKRLQVVIMKNLNSLCFPCSVKACLFKFPVTTFSESAYNLGIHFEIKKSSSSCRCVMKSSRHVAPSTSPIHSRAARGCLKHSAAAGDFVKKKSSQQMEARRSRPSVQLDLLRFILILSFSR